MINNTILETPSRQFNLKQAKPSFEPENMSQSHQGAITSSLRFLISICNKKNTPQFIPVSLILIQGIPLPFPELKFPF